MNKLVVGLGALSMTLGAVAEVNYFFSEGCDLTTGPYSSDYDCWGVYAQPGTTQNFWLSGDLDKNYDTLMAETTGNASTSATIDFRGHTMYLSRSLFILNATTVGEGAYSMPPAYLTLKNGTFDGRNQGTTMWISRNWRDSAINGHVVLENMTITNLAAMSYGTEMASSDITFRNSNLYIDYLAQFQHSNHGECDTTITYENTIISTPGDFTSDYCVTDPDQTSDYNHKVVFTGSRTRASAGRSFIFGTGRPYFKCDVLDGAQLVSSENIFFGFSATSHHGQMRFDNATLDGGWAILVGYVAGHQMLSFNKSKLDVDELYVGWNADDNTVVATNCDFTSMNWIRIGGTSVNTNAPKNNKLIINGQDTQFKTYGYFPFEFYGANGLIAFDDITINWPNVDFCFRPINSKGPDGSEWYDNEVVFQNGANVTLNDLFIGSPFESNLQVNYQRIKVLGETKLSVKAMVVGGNYDEVIISNATLEARSSNLLWLGHNNTETAMGNNVLRFQGDHPKMRSTWSSEESNSIVILENTPTIEYTLPEDLTYKEVPLESQLINGLQTFTDASLDYINFSFPNLKEIQETTVGTKEVELMRGTKHFELVMSSAEEEAALISYINSTLPEGCSIYRTNTWPDAGSLYLRVKGGAAAKPGAVLIVK